ncbi:MAG: hypothetical protein SFU98_18905 [Leptospiraceae bacterium]|nr:hypothetical protein [Leptospiraceae bacterium]
MERNSKVTLEHKKVDLIESILRLRSMDSLVKIETFLTKISPEQTKIQKSQRTFTEWNNQFHSSKKELNEFLPEYNMTLLEYRKSIYESEFSGDAVSLSDFLEDLKAWKKKTKKKK